MGFECISLFFLFSLLLSFSFEENANKLLWSLPSTFDCIYVSDSSSISVVATIVARHLDPKNSVHFIDFCHFDGTIMLANISSSHQNQHCILFNIFPLKPEAWSNYLQIAHTPHCLTHSQYENNMRMNENW